MAKHAKVIRLIREKVRDQEYEFVIPHFFEEMANDDLAFDDIENAIMNGAINMSKTTYDYGKCQVCGEQMVEQQIKQDFWIKGDLIVVARRL